MRKNSHADTQVHIEPLQKKGRQKKQILRYYHSRVVLTSITHIILHQQSQN